MKKKLALLVAFMMVAMFALAGCGSQADPAEPSDGEGMVNPMHVCTQEEMCQATGIDLAAPEGATDAQYAYYDVAEGEQPIAEVCYKLDGLDYSYRAQFTDKTSVYCLTNGEEIAVEQIGLESGGEGQLIGYVLSGLNYTFAQGGSAEVAGRSAIFSLNPGEEGYITWLDVVPGILYSLSCNECQDQKGMEDAANAVFVEAQGED